MPEKLSEDSEMTDIAWAQWALKEQIAPQGESKKDRIRKAARALGWKYSRTKDVWYASEKICVQAKEIRQIERETGLTYGKQERAEIEQLISKADALLVGQDPDFYRAFADGMRAFFGALDRSGTEGRDQ